MRVLVLGSTGAVGSEVIRQCAADARVTDILAVSRTLLKVEDSKLRVFVLKDFLDYTSLAREFPSVDACLCALGVSQTEVSDPKLYYTITHDYVLAAARALHAANPRARFLFVSGMGADPSGKRPAMWSRVKGETENHLRDLLGSQLTVFRPGYIYPVHARERKLVLDTLSLPFWWFRKLLPSLVTSTIDVAQSMIQVGLEISQPAMLDNRAITATARRYLAKAHTVS